MQIEIHDRATALLNQLTERLTHRGPLNQMVGRRVQNHIRDYLIQLALTKHDTARSLGATPSGHLGKAAEKVALPEALTEIPDGVMISLSHPGMGRAFHDVEIKPGPGKKFLTIPQIAQAYNQRAYRVEGLVAIFQGPKGVRKGLLAMPDGQGHLTVWYTLVPSVHQKRDPSLMPTRASMSAAALAGAREYIQVLKKMRN